jgi:hypothetical protein
MFDRKIFEQQIQSLDLSLFGGAPSATSDADRITLLRLQRLVRNRGSYIYLEIGSHLGGTIQQVLPDSRCTRIYSIDKRPLLQPDEMRGIEKYPGNSTQRMLTQLKRALPQADFRKLTTFDSDASEIDENRLAEKADFCFIDGEHTNRAVYSDLQFCLRNCKPDAIVALHDAYMVLGGINKVKRTLRDTLWKGYVLPDNIYVFLLNAAAKTFGNELEQVSRSKSSYSAMARWRMFKAKLGIQLPALRTIWHAMKGLNRKRSSV